MSEQQKKHAANCFGHLIVDRNCPACRKQFLYKFSWKHRAKQLFTKYFWRSLWRKITRQKSIMQEMIESCHTPYVDKDANPITP